MDRRHVGRPFYLELRLRRISPAGSGGGPTEGGRRTPDGFIISKEQVGAGEKEREREEEE